MSDSQDDLTRAEDAARLLNEPILQEAFATLERAYVEALIECGKENDDGRYRLSEGIKTVRLVKRHLEQVLETGQVAKREIQELERGRKPFF